MKTTLSLEVLRLFLSLSGRFLAKYGHNKSPHKFTPSQLMIGLDSLTDSISTDAQCSLESQSCVMRHAEDHHEATEYPGDSSSVGSSQRGGPCR